MVGDAETKWDLRNLRDFVERTHSGTRNALALRLIQSQVDCVNVFRFHIWEARDRLAEIETTGGTPRDIELTRILLARTAEDGAKLIALHAHLLGAIHVARSLFEVFAQLCNALILSNPLPIEDCDVKRIAKRLPNSRLRSELEELIRSEWFVYAERLTNAAKHREMPALLLHVDFVDEGSGVIASFVDRDGSVQKRLVRSVLAGITDLQNRVLRCGNALSVECFGSKSKPRSLAWRSSPE